MENNDTNDNKKIYDKAKNKLKKFKDTIVNVKYKSDNNSNIASIKEKEERFSFEHRYSQLKELIKFKKDKSLNHYKNAKFEIKNKYNRYRKLKENTNKMRRYIHNFMLGTCFSSILTLIYLGPIQKKINISLKLAIFLPIFSVVGFHIIVRKQINEHYKKTLDLIVNDVETKGTSNNVNDINIDSSNSNSNVFYVEEEKEKSSDNKNI